MWRNVTTGGLLFVCGLAASVLMYAPQHKLADSTTLQSSLGSDSAQPYFAALTTSPLSPATSMAVSSESIDSLSSYSQAEVNQRMTGLLLHVRWLISQNKAPHRSGGGGGGSSNTHLRQQINALQTEVDALAAATSSTVSGSGLATTSIDTSAELLAILTDETGTGNAVFSASPTFTGTLNAADGYLSGNVGIGTTQPDMKLHVEDSVAAGGVVGAKFRNTSSDGFSSAMVGHNSTAVYLDYYNSSYSDSVTNSLFESEHGAVFSGTGAAGLNIAATGAAAAMKFFTGGYDSTNERLRITAAGNVGIGTSTPTSKFTVAGTVKPTGSFRDYGVNYFTQEFHSAIFGSLNGSNYTNGYVNMSVDTTVDLTSSNAESYGIVSTLRVTNSDSGNYSYNAGASFVGDYLAPVNNASNAVLGINSNGYNSSGYTLGTVQGGRFAVSNKNANSAITDATGVFGDVRQFVATNLMTNASTFKGSIFNGLGTMTNAYGINIVNLSNTGTIANTYGVYVGDITAGTQTNTPYSFYASDPNARNYFAGNTGIGTSTPTAKLAVNVQAAPTGVELITNGSFTGSAAGWTLGNCAAYGSNQVTVTYTSCAQPNLSTTFPSVAGTTYYVTFTISNVSDGEAVYLNIFQTANYYQSGPFKNGTHTVAYTTTYTGAETLQFSSYLYTANGAWTIDNVSVKQGSVVSSVLSLYNYTGNKVLDLGGNLGNITVGSNAGGSSVGSQNTFVGDNSGVANTTGRKNTFVGDSAGIGNTTGYYNTFIGADIALANNTSVGNTFLGRAAGSGITSGSSNLFAGSISGYKNTTGFGNTLVGAYAASNQTVANFNTIVGWAAGNNITTGSSNIILGNQIDAVSATASNQLNIGNLIFGTGLDGTGATLSTGKIGIGTTTPWKKFSVTGDVSITGALFDTSGDAGTSGQVLLSSMSGTNWTSTSSLGISSSLSNDSVTPNHIKVAGQTDEYCLTYESTGTTWEWQPCNSTNVFTDGGSTTYLTSSDSLGIGTTTANQKLTVEGNINLSAATGALYFDDIKFLYASPSNHALVFGESAGATITGAGTYNIFMGYEAGRYASSTNVDYNNHIGYRAGYYNNRVGNNIIGREAGYRNDGFENNLMGYQTGYQNTGNYNNIIGYTAGYQNTGSNNNIIGYGAGYTNAGDNNIVIGYQAADNMTSGNNNIIIGHDIDNVTATADNRLNIGNLIFATGLDGTGTTLATGNVGIGTTTPAQELQVFGDIRVGTAGNNGCLEDNSGGVIAGTCSSDERLKENITPIAQEGKSYLEALAVLTPVTYNWNERAVELYRKNGSVQNLGLIAQDVEAVFPELVSINDEGFRQVDFRALPFYLMEALKELWEKVKGHDERIEELEQENEFLKERITNIEDELNLEAPPSPSPTPEETTPESTEPPAPTQEVSPQIEPAPTTPEPEPQLIVEVPEEATPEPPPSEPAEEPTFTLVPGVSE